MADIIEKKIEIGSCVVHCLQAGNPQGKNILMLHGMKFQAETWKELKTIEQLADSGYWVTALDLPGFGKSEACAVEQGDILKEFISAADLQQPVLIGPSMGGRVSMEFALDNPSLVGGLVLVGAVGVPENKERLPQINIPCLIIWGGEDAISPIENGQILNQSIKKSKLVVIDGAPHPCYLENADLWHKELLNFLKEQFD